MKKNTFLLLSAFLFSTFLSAQVTLTYPTHGIVVGDVSTVFDVNPTGVNLGSPGTGQTWNFSTINIYTNFETDTFLDPSTTPYAANFPTSNLASRRGVDA